MAKPPTIHLAALTSVDAARAQAARWVVVPGAVAMVLFLLAGLDELVGVLASREPIGESLSGWLAVGVVVGVVLALLSSIFYWRMVGVARDNGRRLAQRLAAEEEVERRRRADRFTIRALIAEDGVLMHFQPIVDVRTGRVRAHEALARFEHGGPEEWFARAANVGLQVELELHAVRLALEEGLPRVAPGDFLSVNVSPATLVDPRLADLISEDRAPRVTIELTEHDKIDQYEGLLPALAHFRLHGARLAVDDVGSGYSTLCHILRLAPDTIKIDRGIVSGLDHDPAHHAMVAALTTFAREMGMHVVAEGVETRAEHESLAALGVHFGQGWLYGRPTLQPVHVAPWAAARLALA